MCVPAAAAAPDEWIQFCIIHTHTHTHVCNCACLRLLPVPMNHVTNSTKRNATHFYYNLKKNQQQNQLHAPTHTHTLKTYLQNEHARARLLHVLSLSLSHTLTHKSLIQNQSRLSIVGVSKLKTKPKRLRRGKREYEKE